MCVISEAALPVQNAMVGILSSRATPSAKLISIVVSTHVTGGTPGVQLSRVMTSLNGAAQLVLTAISRPRP